MLLTSKSSPISSLDPTPSLLLRNKKGGERRRTEEDGLGNVNLGNINLVFQSVPYKRKGATIIYLLTVSIYNKYNTINPKIFVSKNFRVRNFGVKKFSDASVCPKIKHR